MMAALDLFCGGGGASLGLKRAGFEVTGVDHIRQREYPYDFWLSDVLTLSPHILRVFDLIWASPPCQQYSKLKFFYRGKIYPELLEKTKTLLIESGRPFVIENVVGAPLRRDLLLCGKMFGLKIYRHRIFEIHGFKVPQLEHLKHRHRIGMSGYRDITGRNFKLSDAQEVMRLRHIRDCYTISQAIPPAYSRYIALKFLESIKGGNHG